MEEKSDCAFTKKHHKDITELEWWLAGGDLSVSHTSQLRAIATCKIALCIHLIPRQMDIELNLKDIVTPRKILHFVSYEGGYKDTD